jgi:hypothetical protein
MNDNYRFRELREKYKEIDEYFRLDDKWTHHFRSGGQPKEVQITQQMINDFRSQNVRYFDDKRKDFSVDNCKRALTIANGDFEKALEYL